MGVNNKLIDQKVKNPLVTFYKAGNAEVKLSPDVVKKYLVCGNADKVTNQDIVLFINYCKFQQLNPFLREAYLIKYGNDATIVTGKAALEKRANRCEDYAGFDAGIYVINKNGELEKRIGTLLLDQEKLVGGWCDVYTKRFEHPVKITVSINEYIGTKKDGTVNNQWATKPATMIRKVAKMQALREAFPENFSGMYSAEEMGVDELDLPKNEINPDFIEAEPIEPEQQTDSEAAFADILGGAE